MSLHGENKRNLDATDVTKNGTPDSSNSGSWQTVTVVMICVLSVTGVLFMVLVAVTWHICRRQNKEALVAHPDQGITH